MPEMLNPIPEWLQDDTKAPDWWPESIGNWTAPQPWNKNVEPVEREGGTLLSLLRMLASVTGADNPQEQVMGIAAPLQVPGRAAARAVSRALRRIDDPITAYHGTPHDYAAERLIRDAAGNEQFIVGAPGQLPEVPSGATLIEDYPLGRQRLDKIGTGEGAQAYGYGAYNSEATDLARRYRDTLKWRGSDWDDIQNLAAQVLETRGGDRLAAARVLREAAERNSRSMFGGPVNPGQLRANADNIAAAELLESGAAVTGKPPTEGNLYEVAIHARPEDLLDWDAPLSQQSARVREAVASQRLGGETGEPVVARMQMGAAEEAQDLINRGLPAPAETPSQVVSQRLSDLGIPGLRYLDQGSRAAGEGTRNYVIWDESLIEILRKLALAAGVGVPAMQQAFANGPSHMTREQLLSELKKR